MLQNYPPPLAKKKQKTKIQSPPRSTAVQEAESVDFSDDEIAAVLSDTPRGGNTSGGNTSGGGAGNIVTKVTAGVSASDREDAAAPGASGKRAPVADASDDWDAEDVIEEIKSEDDVSDFMEL
jgi:hypothetical protein